MAKSHKRGRASLRPPMKRGGGGLSYVLIVILLFLVGGASYLAVQAYTSITSIGENLNRTFATPVPVTGTPAPTPNPLEEPINILLLGVDRRDGDVTVLNDVNIVVHIDPVHYFATMLSIPRDTRVQIPGHYAAKINAAYSLGEQYHADAGGGPVLAKRTVANFLDIKIHYYAEVNFQGFEHIVDLLGGITVDVPFPLLDNEYPTEDYGYTRIYIPAGLQHMDGRTALQYARSRHSDPQSDIGRNQRQQQVLMAIREQALTVDLLKDLFIGSPQVEELLQEVGDSFRTDMSKNTLIALAQLAPKINLGNIESYALDYNTCLGEASDGSYDLIPSLGCVYDIVKEMEADPTMRRLRQEGARVQVLNGTDWCQGCAGRTGEYLQLQGFNVVDIGNDEGTYTQTLLLDNADHSFSREMLVSLLGVDPAAVQVGVNYSAIADIVIILGDDYQEPQP